MNNKGSSMNRDRYSSNAVDPLLPIEVEAGSIMSVLTDFDEIRGAGPGALEGLPSQEGAFVRKRSV
jgi:hypothetical protein